MGSVLNESDFKIYMRILSHLNHENKIRFTTKKNEKYSLLIQEIKRAPFSDKWIFRYYYDYQFPSHLGVTTSTGAEEKPKPPMSVIINIVDKSYRKVSR
jgi:hypothetical protein